MAAARLRKAFHYPDDSGDNEHEREELDEEGVLYGYARLIQSFTNNFAEQELVINRLRVQNDKHNAEFTVNISLQKLSLSIAKHETQTRYHLLYRSPSLPSHYYQSQYSFHQ